VETWIAFILLFSTAFGLGDAQAEPNFAMPPDVRIIRCDWVRDAANQPFPQGQISRGNLPPTGNEPYRAEYGVDRRTGSALPNSTQSQIDFRSHGYRLALSLENTGTRTIKTVEWELGYIRRGGSNPATGPLSLKEAKWKKIRSKVRIRPSAIASVRTADLPPNDRSEYESYVLPARVGGRQQNGGLFTRPSIFLACSWIRLCRIVYTEGPDWRASRAFIGQGLAAGGPEPYWIR